MNTTTLEACRKAECYFISTKNLIATVATTYAIALYLFRNTSNYWKQTLLKETKTFGISYQFFLETFYFEITASSSYSLVYALHTTVLHYLSMQWFLPSTARPTMSNLLIHRHTVGFWSV